MLAAAQHRQLALAAADRHQKRQWIAAALQHPQLIRLLFAQLPVASRRCSGARGGWC